MNFVNRARELEVLEKWWAKPGPGMGMVYGRRRVGKTALIREFARDKRAIIHLGTGVPLQEELARLTRVMTVHVGRRGRAVVNWEEAIEMIAEAAQREPILLVLDEFPELLASDPHIEARLRAVWEEVLSAEAKLKVLLTGSAVRTMWSMTEARRPLYGRFDFFLLVHPFRPHEAALMLRDLKPAERAVAWGVCDGTPLYLSHWDQSAGIEQNIHDLLCTPDAFLYNEARQVLLTDGVGGGLTKQVLSAIALGKNRHSEIVDVVKGDRQVARVLDDLERLRLVERVLPVTDDPRARTGRTTYRIADNFLAFWLAVVERNLQDIDFGLSGEAAKAINRRIDDFMGSRYEEAFRDYLRRTDGHRVGPYWTRGGAQVEIDAVMLDTDEVAIAVGECKWQQKVSGAELRTKLLRAARVLPNVLVEPEVIVCARDEVTEAERVRAVTAIDMFG
ncbi:MAG TPA: ATP-binding protein [Candidatus Limnocylindrales bacterium]